jgi:hypothetical protein
MHPRWLLMAEHGGMADDRARRFYQFLLTDDASSLDCVAVLDLIHRFVRLRELGHPADAMMPVLAAHFETCEPCRDVLDSVAEMARLEEAGQLPEVDALWDSLREVTGVTGRAGAGAAIAGATSPLRPVPTPSRPQVDAMRAAAGGAAASDRPWWRRPLTWGLAAAGLALVAIWWQGDRAVSRHEQLLQDLGDSTLVRSERADSGSWARVFFDPSEEDAVVYAGGLPDLGPGERLECWLKSGGGERLLAELKDGGADGPEWWQLDTAEPLRESDVVALMVSGGEQRRSVVEVRLDDAP